MFAEIRNDELERINGGSLRDAIVFATLGAFTIKAAPVVVVSLIALSVVTAAGQYIDDRFDSN